MVQSAQSNWCFRGAGRNFSRFEVHADLCPQVMAKILGTLAAQNLIPLELCARRSCRGLWMTIHLDLAAAPAERLAERLRAMVGVELVILIPARAEPTA